MFFFKITLNVSKFVPAGPQNAGTWDVHVNTTTGQPNDLPRLVNDFRPTLHRYLARCRLKFSSHSNDLHK